MPQPKLTSKTSVQAIELKKIRQLTQCPDDKDLIEHIKQILLNELPQQLVTSILAYPAKPALDDQPQARRRFLLAECVALEQNQAFKIIAESIIQGSMDIAARKATLGEFGRYQSILCSGRASGVEDMLNLVKGYALEHTQRVVEDAEAVDQDSL